MTLNFLKTRFFSLFADMFGFWEIASSSGEAIDWFGSKDDLISYPEQSTATDALQY